MDSRARYCRISALDEPTQVIDVRCQYSRLDASVDRRKILRVLGEKPLNPRRQSVRRPLGWYITALTVPEYPPEDANQFVVEFEKLFPAPWLSLGKNPGIMTHPVGVRIPLLMPTMVVPKVNVDSFDHPLVWNHHWADALGGVFKICVDKNAPFHLSRRRE